MNATRHIGLSLGALAFLGALAGCSMQRSPETAAPQSDKSAAGASEPQAGLPEATAPAAPADARDDAFSGQAASSAAQKKSEEASPLEPRARPGLGTEWGETRRSGITTVAFVRADPTTPIATASFFYNDQEGARAMASAADFRRTSAGAFSSAGGMVSIGMRDEGGSFLSGFVADGRNFVIGDAGRRYTIVLRNNTDLRLEVVLSVDGLDVIDGKSASFNKRGYLIDPRGELEVDGFRQSTETVAAFRFGSVRGSYASQKHGDTRNVGVIGVALFNERGTNARMWTDEEVRRRLKAEPFPGQFATPPGT